MFAKSAWVIFFIKSYTIAQLSIAIEASEYKNNKQTIEFFFLLVH